MKSVGALNAEHAKSIGWKPGQSGNPRGRPKMAYVGAREEMKEIQEVTALARRYSRAAIKTLAFILKKGKTENVRLHAAIAILDRGCGAPPRFTTNSAEEFRKVTELRDHELDALIARGVAEGRLKPIDAQIAQSTDNLPTAPEKSN